VRLIDDPEPAPGEIRTLAPSGIEWGVQRIHADSVWSTYGAKGEGIVVAGQDTGVQWDHPALIDHYRGWNGTGADHNYNWHDAIHISSGSSCGGSSPFPCDDHNHGTHTMGTMVGDDGAGNQIGVAPEAKWIACRNMDQGVGTPATYTECFEWFMAPYPLGGNPLTDGNPAMAPHIINNSWGCPPSEGCSQDTLDSIVSAVRDAGIMVVVSNGNSGSACSTTDDPPSLYEAAFSVGATSSSDGLASFSSRGPVTYKGRTYRKPDIAAPGVNIRSSVRGGLYESGWSGTSMAAPHVAGAAALLWSAVPALKGNVDLTEDILELRASPKDFTSCGDPAGVPNNGYGYGIVDALNAVQNPSFSSDVALSMTDHPDPVSTGGELTYTLTVENGGPDAATGIILTDTLPPEVTFVSADPALGSCHYSGGLLTCDIDRIEAGASEVISVKVTVRTEGILTNSATVTLRGDDPNPTNNSVTSVTSALLDLIPLTVLGSGAGSGSVKGGGIDCAIAGGTSSGSCIGTFEKDAEVVLIASSETGSFFDGWSGCDFVEGPESAQCHLVMAETKSVTAAFRLHTIPFITEVTPDLFGLGETVVIHGLNFGTKKPAVRLGSVKGKVRTWSPDLITCSFTKGTAGTRNLVVTADKVLSNPYPSTLSNPVIEDASNREGSPGDPIVLSGRFFGIKKLKVLFTSLTSGASKKAKIISAAPDPASVELLVPKAAAGAYEIRLRNGPLTSDPLPYTVLPLPPKP
jgi:uncharacterized repeat protein (TIGR01451 family)